MSFYLFLSKVLEGGATTKIAARRWMCQPRTQAHGRRTQEEMRFIRVLETCTYELWRVVSVFFPHLRRRAETW